MTLERTARRAERQTASPSDEITICICTCRRLELLERLLAALASLETASLFTYSCLVVDNDATQSARPLVESFAARSAFPIRYAVEPERNFASVRNRALAFVQSSFVAFIDDDEIPAPEWLLQLWRALHTYGADAALGPVVPYFEDTPPRWIVRSRICERQAFRTGSLLHWKHTRTGNVLFRRAMIDGDELTQEELRFDTRYGSGGEDVDFFRRAAAQGRSFVWCNEAPVRELVPRPRLTRRYHLRRAVLQGRISFGYAIEQPSPLAKARVVAKALLAICAYAALLPFLFLLGEHLGMKYLIKLCHHTSRLLAALGARRPATRNF